MSTDLDTRLRGLTELSPPSHQPLGAEELHQRATRIQHRALAARAIPAAFVILALLAGAIALRTGSTTTDVVVGPPDASVATEAGGISERDQQVLGFLRTVVDLRQQLDREMVLSATYASTDGNRGLDALEAQRSVTDVALAAYTEQAAAILAGPGASDADLAPMVESIKQADNRVVRLPITRTAVDGIQSDAIELIETYANTAAALQDVQIKFLVAVDDPDVFRGVLTASNLGTYAHETARTSAYLTVAVEIGFYAQILPKGASPGAFRGACDPDPSAAGDECPLYELAIESSSDADQLMNTFQTFATGQQKQAFRAAEAGSSYDQMKANAIEDGIGRNDLTGTEPGTVTVEPLAWQAAVLDHLDRFASVERQFYDQIGTTATEQEPAAEPGSGAGSSDGTLPTPTVTIPTDGSPTPTVSGQATATTGPPSSVTPGTSETRRETELEPNSTNP